MQTGHSRECSIYVWKPTKPQIRSRWQPRTTYSLRHYALQTRLNKSGGKVNIYDLARNAGTSVNQLGKILFETNEGE